MSGVAMTLGGRVNLWAIRAGDRHGAPLTTTAKFPRGYRQDQDRHSRAFANAWPPIGQAREPNSVDQLCSPIAPLEPDRRLT